MSAVPEEADSTPSGAPESVGGEVAVAGFAAAGEQVAKVPVRLSYGIIERFSEGLYSSPNKTFEELVTNSYDAGANRVWVYLPHDFGDPAASLVVVDDGSSMDLQGLQGLWRIGESSKRGDTPPPGRKRPVGKFGIGKLATYVLATKLTYIVHQGDEYLAVTMDYGRIGRSEELLDSVQLSLDVVSLTQEQAIAAVRTALEPFADPDEATVVEQLASLEHWTAAILTDLKPAARGIRVGRLRWILRTALPLNPDFGLYLNDEEIESSKVDGEVLWTFVAGKNESTLAKSDDAPWSKGTVVEVETVADDGTTSKAPGIRLPTAGTVWGTAALFKEPLERGKSEDLGRSHGFFIRVRGRLINLDDEDFSLGPELRHGTLTRFRMEVNADDLDDQVASARETIKESAALTELKQYLLAIFNKARSVSWEHDRDDIPSRLSKSGRLAEPPSALSQGPLRRMLRRALTGDPAILEAIGLVDEQRDQVESLLETDDDVIEHVLIETRGERVPFVTYDPERRAAILNQSHPFVLNYMGGSAALEPMKLLGLAELLAQAYLIDENVRPESVARVVKRRDSLLRALTSRYPRSAPVIAQQLRDATNDENALEDAVGDALELLGYDVFRLGGSEHGVDGVATARLGLRDRVESDSYAFTYDAKSTKDAVTDLLTDDEGNPTRILDEDGNPIEKKVGRIRADTARTSILRVHRERATEAHDLDVVPSFTLLIAPDFQGANDDEGLINAVCLNDSITAIRVSDLARLVELFALQGLNPLDLRTLFERRTPEETRAWVDEQSAAARVPAPPVSALVDCLVKHSDRKRPTSHEALGAYLTADGYDLSLEEIEGLIRGLAALAPKSIYNDDRVVALNATPAGLYAELRSSLDQFDNDLVHDYLETVPEEGEK